MGTREDAQAREVTVTEIPSLWLIQPPQPVVDLKLMPPLLNLMGAVMEAALALVLALMRQKRYTGMVWTWNWGRTTSIRG